MSDELQIFEDAAVRRPRREILADVRLLLDAHAAGKLGGAEMPEDALEFLFEDVALLDVLTLGMSLNYQRNSYSLWASVAKGFAVAEDRWVFNPQSVAEHSEDDLREILLRHRIALQPNRHVAIWRRVGTSLAAHGGVRQLVAAANQDVVSLREIVCFAEKKNFPYLSGPKIFNYWLYVLERYGRVAWTNRFEITIAPDTHVLQATIHLGLLDSTEQAAAVVKRSVVSDAWKTLLHGTGIDEIDVHSPLWLWSRSGFPPLV